MTTYRQELKSRFAALGLIVLMVLGALLFRLWSLQVLSGKDFAAKAENNRIREIALPAPRGRILDRKGRPIVANRAVLAVSVDPSNETIREVLIGTEKRAEQPMSAAELKKRLGAFSEIIGVPIEEIVDRIRTSKLEPLRPRVVALDVPMSVVSYLAEHESRFPYASVEAVAIRDYPNKSLAAHVVGYTGEISETQLADPDMAGYRLGDIVGKSGAEAQFEAILQGDKGYRRFEVDALGRPRGVIDERAPIPGRDIRLTLDLDVQRVAEQALAEALEDAHSEKFPNAKAGAAVVLDVKTAEVVAMASAPTYDPTLFVGGISSKEWKALTDKDSEYPLNNRAITGAYPPASTFKVVTGLAGLENGNAQPYSTYYCSGTWTDMGEQWKKRCWKRSGHGTISFTGGVADSCDVVFYEIGYDFYKQPGEKLQKFARSLGLGKRTGIDLPGEAPGRVPDKAWKKEFNANYPEYQMWLPGDTVNMAIGQGDMLVTPLQIADIYAAVGDSGKMKQPRILKEVVPSKGQKAYRPKTKLNRTAKISASSLAAMRNALLQVTEGGTGASAFAGFPMRVAGKTGTAQVYGKDDFAWFAAYAPAEDPQYAVAIVIEQGGHGGSVAAPAARTILSELFDLSEERAQDESR